MRWLWFIHVLLVAGSRDVRSPPQGVVGGAVRLELSTREGGTWGESGIIVDAFPPLLFAFL